jgi:hypothetical protein
VRTPIAVVQTLLNNTHLLQGPVRGPFSRAYTIAIAPHCPNKRLRECDGKTFWSHIPIFSPNLEASAYDDLPDFRTRRMCILSRRRYHSCSLFCRRCHGDVTLIAHYDISSHYDTVHSTRRNAARSRQCCRTSPSSVERPIARNSHDDIALAHLVDDDDDDAFQNEIVTVRLCVH